MHDEIIRFSFSGELPDSNVVQAKERMTQAVEGMMKDNGCIPVLDLLPQFTLDFDPEKETFRFELTLYGVFVGKGDSWQTAGMMNGTTITNSIQTPKLKES